MEEKVAKGDQVTSLSNEWNDVSFVRITGESSRRFPTRKTRLEWRSRVREAGEEEFNPSTRLRRGEGKIRRKGGGWRKEAMGEAREGARG